MRHMKKRILILTAVILLIQVLWTVPAHGGSFLVARVADVNYPRRVACKQDFSIAVTFEYASKVLVDVGIFEEEGFRVVESLTLISGFFGPGNVTLIFNLTAPESSRVWRLMASTRAWWEGSWFTDPDVGSKPFTIEVVRQDRFWLNVSSRHPFEVDGLRIDPSTRQEPGLFLNRGRHTIFAQQTKLVNEQIQLVFDRWSDGVRSNPRTINLFSDAKLTAIYRTQYFLSVDSEHGEPLGSGWYDENTTAWFAVLPEVRIRNLGIVETTYSFDKWTEDSTEHNSAGSILMTGPKQVHALWQRKLGLPLFIQLHFLSISMILVSILLLVRLVRRKHVGIDLKLSLRALEKRKAILAVFIVLLACSSILPAKAIDSSAIIKLRETSWRHWQNADSDTCIIWLGGGTEGSQLILNPYWLESYNTMRFVQDLARYYSVLTLEAGSSTIRQTALNRTVMAEFYPSMLIHEAKAWAIETGYQYVYLAGYSVGGIAAAKEATVADPRAWSSPNGIILITVPLEQFVRYANAMKANHLILYGTEMTRSFIDSGLEYYQSTPAEGQYGDQWLHKEFHVINKMAHEVWTVAQTGTYDSEAIEVTVNFIERSRGLQSERQRNLLGVLSNVSSKLPTSTQSRVKQIRVDFPERVSLEEIFRVSVTISMQRPNRTQAWVMLYSSEASSILSVRDLSSKNESMGLILLSRASSQRTRMYLNIFVLCNEGELWTFPAGNHSIPIVIRVQDEVTIRIRTSLPGIPIRIDTISLRSNDAGTVELNVVPGYHVIEVPSAIQLTSAKRAVFEGWDDGTRSARRTVRISEVSQIEAFFRPQYYVSVSSEFGYLAGEGWYDHNTTATIMVSPSIVQDRVGETLIIRKFERWSFDADGRNVALTVGVTGPLEVKAHWVSISSEEEISPFYFVEVLLSFLLLAISMVLARKRNMI